MSSDDDFPPGWRSYVRASMEPIRHDYLPGWSGPFWTWTIVAACFIRGTDLATAPDGRSELSAWVNVFGNHFYGHMFIFAALFIAATKIIGKIGPLVIALAFAVAANTMYAIALLQGVFTSEDWTGWRFGGLALLAAIHAAARIATLFPSVRRIKG